MSSNIKKLRITVDGKQYDVAVEMLGEPETRPNVGQALQAIAYAPVSAPIMAPAASRPVAAAGAVACPLSGTVIQVHVNEGQAVKVGELLVTLEAMKMNTPIFAPSDGTVRQISARQGALVEEGAALLVLE